MPHSLVGQLSGSGLLTHVFVGDRRPAFGFTPCLFPPSLFLTFLLFNSLSPFVHGPFLGGLSRAGRSLLLQSRISALRLSAASAGRGRRFPFFECDAAYRVSLSAAVSLLLHLSGDFREGFRKISLPLYTVLFGLIQALLKFEVVSACVYFFPAALLFRRPAGEIGILGLNEKRKDKHAGYCRKSSSHLVRM